ncbi:MAG: DUF4388 domain-containing protein [Deltaproteobacteria bacterium]|nr:DUF4388 domain-containing protein [Deltaproteobacteria bacterium]
MEGNVKEFGLADVIQFISTSQKTGVLKACTAMAKAPWK